MRSVWSRGIVVASAVAALGLVGCSNDPCLRAVPCPNDPAPTQAERMQCQTDRMQAEGAACYAEGLAFLNCSFDNAVCGSDGRTDGLQTSARLQANCSATIQALQACCTANPTSGNCAPGGDP